jgi:hypothetical protein
VIANLSADLGLGGSYRGSGTGRVPEFDAGPVVASWVHDQLFTPCGSRDASRDDELKGNAVLRRVIHVLSQPPLITRGILEFDLSALSGDDHDL